MESRTLYLSKLIGLYCLLVGLAMLVQKAYLLNAMVSLITDESTAFIIGFVLLGVGIAMVLAHNVWSGGALRVIVTLIGWLTLLKGLAALVFPPKALLAYYEALHYDSLFYVYAGIVAVLGAYLTWSGFKMAGKGPA